MLHRIVIVLILSCSWANAAPVNINQADADLIAKSLNGIGPSKAAAIVEFRKENGPFKTADELKYVKGLGKKTIEVNRQDIIITDIN